MLDIQIKAAKDAAKGFKNAECGAYSIDDFNQIGLERIFKMSVQQHEDATPSLYYTCAKNAITDFLRKHGSIFRGSVKIYNNEKKVK